MNKPAYRGKCVPNNLQELVLSRVFINTDRERLLVPISATESGMNYYLGDIATGKIITTTHGSISDLWYDEHRKGSKSIVIATEEDLRKVPRNTELKTLLKHRKNYLKTRHEYMNVLSECV